jgi:uncharacterized protein YbcI
MDKNLPTCGQLERNLSQSIQKLYITELQHSPTKVTCQFFSSQLAIVIDNAITTVEQTLAESNELDTVKKLNSAINQSIKQKIKTLIEETLRVDVNDILFDSDIETYRTGAILTLAKLPQVRNPESIPKSKRK